MNKHLHRVVFNAARGQRMAVQETASSAGKGRARTTGSALAVTLAGLLGGLSAQAQIVANPFAAAGQRPQVLMAPNGVPLVNIGTPSAAGVSINSYNRFDVQAAGAILNNSRTNVQTQLGGWVQGNPWLALGPARIIVNQVSSSDPSHLRGYVEVAGQRAEVVIA
ncbi:ESPR-type extended signal peptide-containing protein, partial [Xenophilus arseniciresistens]